MCSSKSLESKTHAGLCHLVNLHFVRPGRPDPGVARFLAELQADRGAADYDPAAVFAQEKLKRAEAFFTAVRKAIVDS